MFSFWGQVRTATRLAHDRRLEDARLQRKTIMVDADGMWLIDELNFIGNAPITVTMRRAMQFSFFSEQAEVVLSQSSESNGLTVIDMPAGSVMSRLSGNGFDDWVFRVLCKVDGANVEYIDVSFRKMDTGDHLLYLRQHKRVDALVK